jgi:hypothetical protein
MEKCLSRTASKDRVLLAGSRLAVQRPEKELRKRFKRKGSFLST